jgi:hypothetical protein
MTSTVNMIEPGSFLTSQEPTDFSRTTLLHKVREIEDFIEATSLSSSINHKSEMIRKEKFLRSEISNKQPLFLPL